MPGPVDRTSEFASLLENVKSRKHLVNTGNRPNIKQLSQFSSAAAEVGRKLSATLSKLKPLTMLAKDRGASETSFNALTSDISHDIKQLSGSIQLLQGLVEQKKAGVNTNTFTEQHASHVVGTLNTQLQTATKSFKSILEQRNEVLKASTERQQREYTFDGLARSSQSPQRRGISLIDSETGFSLPSAPSLHRNVLVENVPEGQMSQELISRPQSNIMDGILRERSTAVRQIESTIHELSSIFTQLASMVHEQGEMLKRIDTDVEEASTNVTQAEGVIAKVLERTISNRGMILKVFGVLALFIVLFAVVF